MNGWTNDTEVGNYLIKNVSEEAFQDFLDCLSDQPDLSDCPSAKHEYIRLTNNVLKELLMFKYVIVMMIYTNGL
jgi:hypothetical protein